MQPTPYIWMNGELVDWDAATVHIGTHGLHYGSGVFEGIRCYETPDGSAVFRLTDHLRRLEASARLIGLDLPFTVDELARATLDLVAANELPSCYIRPIAFLGYGTLGVRPQANPVEVGIMAWPWDAFLGEDAAERDIRAKVSSWRRVGPNTIPHAAKATGVYVNSLLAVQEAIRAGYDEAILLTEDGYVGDGSGENVFVVKDGVVATPALSASILSGITRDSILRLAEALGHETREAPLIRTDLSLADEVFLCGTAVEIAPVRSIDDHELGDPGPATRALQRAYRDAVTGCDPRFEHWLEPVPATVSLDRVARSRSASPSGSPRRYVRSSRAASGSLNGGMT